MTTNTTHAPYGWIIDHETVTDGCDDLPTRKGWTGPRDISPEIDRDLKSGVYGKPFRMLDDDGNVYYSGRYLGPDDESMFGPLDDLGTPDAGAVTIQYRDGARWVTL